MGGGNRTERGQNDPPSTKEPWSGGSLTGSGGAENREGSLVFRGGGPGLDFRGDFGGKGDYAGGAGPCPRRGAGFCPRRAPSRARER